MQILEGIAVSPGVAIGEALVIDNEGFRIPQRFVSRDAVNDELDRLRDAIQRVQWEIEQNELAVSSQLGRQYGAIFGAHLQIVRDPQLGTELEALVRERHYSPEFAVSRTLRRYAKVFQQAENARLVERADDIFDIEKRLLRNLLGHRREELTAITSSVIVLAHNLTPSETAALNTDYVLGFVTELGGLGSHSAIVAEAKGIAAVVGVGEFLTDVSGGETVIVDGDAGHVILQPDEETLARYQHELEEHQALQTRLADLKELPAETLDGTAIKLLANIEFPHEAGASLDRGAGGIGLFRTEFLYLISEAEPDEETQFKALAEVVQTMQDRPVVIRTLDLGADKMRGLSPSQEEKNPFLGLRSIRLCLRNLPMFRTQLRAILRASALGNVRVMFPLVSTLQELRQAKMLLTDVMEDLEEEKIAYNRHLPVGIMVEVPATVMMLDRFLEEADFVSIGTNDLIQYTLAVDRSNNEVAPLYNTADPAVLRLIEMSVAAAGRASIDISLCGQMSGNPTYTMLLLGLGLRDLSVPPHAIPEIKKICRSVNITDCQDIAQRALNMDNARDIKNMLREELRKTAPELVLH